MSDGVGEILAVLAELSGAVARVEERVSAVPALESRVTALERVRWRIAGAATLAGAAVAAVPAWLGVHW